MNLGLNKKIVELKKHLKSWKKYFDIESKKLKKILHEFDIEIEHIGSTSIPNMEAKPIIDILIGINPFSALKTITKILEMHNYILSPISFGKNELLFAKVEKGEDSRRTHYIHVVERNGNKWDNYILFRNYLIANPNEAKRYLKLKKELSISYSNNRMGYTEKKGEFVKEILKKAKNH